MNKAIKFILVSTGIPNFRNLRTKKQQTYYTKYA